MRLCLLLLLGACQMHRATRANCERILERIVDIELQERGYRDPMLQTIKRTTFKRKLDTELEHCVGKKIKATTMQCIESATTIEALTHSCF